jgi:hypothetical protein
MRRMLGLGVLAVLLAACGGSPSPATTTTGSAPPRGLGVSLAKVASFFDTHGAEGQYWRTTQSLSAAQGCSQFCGENDESGGEGTGCVIGILGPVGNVDSIGMTCTPGGPLSTTDASPLTDRAAASLLSASVQRFAPSAASCVSPHLDATLRRGSTRTLCTGPGVTVELSSASVSHKRTISMTIQTA